MKLSMCHHPVRLIWLFHVKERIHMARKRKRPKYSKEAVKKIINL